MRNYICKANDKYISVNNSSTSGLLLTFKFTVSITTCFYSTLFSNIGTYLFATGTQIILISSDAKEKFIKNDFVYKRYKAVQQDAFESLQHIENFAYFITYVFCFMFNESTSTILMSSYIIFIIFIIFTVRRSLSVNSSIDLPISFGMVFSIKMNQSFKTAILLFSIKFLYKCRKYIDLFNQQLNT